MRLSQNREFRLEATSAPHIRWVIATLPDAEGQVRAIGQTGKGYSASASWRHPTELKIQLVENSVVIKELERKEKSVCDPRSPRLGTIIKKLTKKLFQSKEITGR